MGKVPSVFVIYVKNDSLALAEHPKQAPFQRTRPEIDRLLVVFSNDHTDPGLGVIDLHNALHRAGL